MKAGTVALLKDIKMKSSSYSLHPYTSARTFNLLYVKYSPSFQYRTEVSLLAMCTYRAFTPEENPKAQASLKEGEEGKSCSVNHCYRNIKGRSKN